MSSFEKCNPCAITYEQYLRETQHDDHPAESVLVCPDTDCWFKDQRFLDMLRFPITGTLKNFSFPHIFDNVQVQSSRTVLFSTRAVRQTWGNFYSKQKHLVPELCQSYGWWKPVRKLLDIADAFLHQNILEPFLAVHWRMGDFVGVAEYKGFASVDLFMTMISSHLRANNLTSLYLATDANSTEVELVVATLSSLSYQIYTNKPILLLLQQDKKYWKDNPHIPPFVRDEKDLIVIEKEVCARAAVFKGSQFSTFSRHIQLMRGDRNSSHPHDGFWHQQHRSVSPKKSTSIVIG
eukprot:CAMPEP_0184644912 /NCGR_PEP_ID=MMETSP0308-20130426/1514_1 /TAXON_ID=38269 /ORGANISM="Gloeochaete witrockiana, Strain SAG 46.84" /LENGTH=292 /DNA_ID=CAMNT_0027073649 /DNA_START=421 /DNA_END=1299 /DNA_ORIENTATION=-